jgi:hypothetical protein
LIARAGRPRLSSSANRDETTRLASL